MVELRVYTEGLGEKLFVETVLAPHLNAFGVLARGASMGHPKGKPAGGIRHWEGNNGARSELAQALQQGSSTYRLVVSTMVDFYGLKMDWPRRREAMATPVSQRGAMVQAGMMASMREALGDDPRIERFVPYISMHELEALLLVQPEVLLRQFPNRAQTVAALIDDIAGIPPEEIDDGPSTAPSKRILRHIPEYEHPKGISAANGLRAIGLQTMRAACPNFHQWISELECLDALN
ncbi:MAG: DUF4276 family protein [Candidatus Competibacteraceae bacterium]|nr:DUF4276 family protein [Candidatus Competibacteraceae bacterium]